MGNFFLNWQDVEWSFASKVAQISSWHSLLHRILRSECYLYYLDEILQRNWSLIVRVFITNKIGSINCLNFTKVLSLPNVCIVSSTTLFRTFSFVKSPTIFTIYESKKMEIFHDSNIFFVSQDYILNALTVSDCLV